MNKVFGIIYKTTCLVNGKIYIGQNTTGNKNYLGSGVLLIAAIKKYGKENFIRETLKECYNQTELDEWEDLLIWEYNSRDRNIGYNIAKGQTIGMYGQLSYTKLPEVRAKMSETKKGKKLSEETKAKIASGNKGKKNSVESRMKMSEAMKGKTRSEETRAKISEAMKGITRSEEFRAKQSIPVLQYDKQCNFIAEYYGANEVERQTGILSTNIIKCCKGKLKSTGGYIWKYK